MTEVTQADITRILADWKSGDESAKDRLLPFVYSELKRHARILMSRERGDHTLQPTALVHEAFMKLDRQGVVDWKDRAHFYGILSRLMRQVLIDHARKYSSAKRNGPIIDFSIDDVNVPVEERAGSLIALSEALEKLESVAERQAEIVEMKFFGGMSNSEIAEALGISERTVAREWQSAKLWLFRELDRN